MKYKFAFFLTILCLLSSLLIASNSFAENIDVNTQGGSLVDKLPTNVNLVIGETHLDVPREHIYIGQYDPDGTKLDNIFLEFEYPYFGKLSDEGVRNNMGVHAVLYNWGGKTKECEEGGRCVDYAQILYEVKTKFDYKYHNPETKYFADTAPEALPSSEESRALCRKKMTLCEKQFPGKIEERDSKGYSQCMYEEPMCRYYPPKFFGKEYGQDLYKIGFHGMWTHELYVQGDVYYPKYSVVCGLNNGHKSPNSSCKGTIKIINNIYAEYRFPYALIANHKVIREKVISKINSFIIK